MMILIFTRIGVHNTNRLVRDYLVIDANIFETSTFLVTD